MSRCEAELCLNWTGDGCICVVMDLDPVIMDDDYNIYGATESEED